MDKEVLDTIRTPRRRPRGGLRPTLLEMVLSASEGHAARPWHFIVIRDGGLRRRISDALQGHPSLDKAFVMVATTVRSGSGSGVSVDLDPVAQGMLVAARSMALGGVWASEPSSRLWPVVEAILLQELKIPGQLGIRMPGDDCPRTP